MSPDRTARRACALVVEVADDRRPAVGLDARARSARRSPPRCDRSSSPAGGRAPGRRRRAGRSARAGCGSRRWPSAPVAAGAAIGSTWPTRVGPRQRDLERDHAAERAAGDERQPVDAERVERAATARAPGRASRPAGTSAPYGRPGRRVERRRAGRAVAAAEQVGAQDADPVRVERAARPDERLPPVAGRVGRAGQRVDDERPAAPSAGPGRRAGTRRSARARTVAVSSANGPSAADSSRPGPRSGDRAPRVRVARALGAGMRRVIRPRRRARRRSARRRSPPRAPGRGRR